MNKSQEDLYVVKSENIYMSIDHLKPGQYKLNILLNNKVVKVFSIKKH